MEQRKKKAGKWPSTLGEFEKKILPRQSVKRNRDALMSWDPGTKCGENCQKNGSSGIGSIRAEFIYIFFALRPKCYSSLCVLDRIKSPLSVSQLFFFLQQGWEKFSPCICFWMGGRGIRGQNSSSCLFLSFVVNSYFHSSSFFALHIRRYFPLAEVDCSRFWIHANWKCICHFFFPSWQHKPSKAG